MKFYPCFAGSVRCFIYKMNGNCRLVIFLVVYHLFYHTNASTHWIVTEDGKIQEQLESPFAINQPHNLVAFMQQERNYNEIKAMKELLLKEKEQIEANEDKDTDLEINHYRQDKDCKIAGKRLSDFDLFISSVLPLENKDIEIREYIDIRDLPEDGIYKEPLCSTLFELPFSIHAYDHLEGVRDRKLLKYYPEAGLKSTLAFMDSLAKSGHVIYRALEKNESSWVAYDLATFYWRLKGNGSEAVECSRRALHFSPEYYRDVALVNLANILHRSRYSRNASIIMKHALEISTHFNVNHFTLANIYAVLGDYNMSTQFYEKTLENQPEFEAARLRLSAVKCQYKLQKKLLQQHESLQRTLVELRSYQKKHNMFLAQQQTLSKMQLDRQTQIDRHFSLIQQMLKEGNFNHKCKFQAKENKPVLYCSLPEHEEADTEINLVPNVKANQENDDGETQDADVKKIKQEDRDDIKTSTPVTKRQKLPPLYNITEQKRDNFRAYEPPTPQDDMSFYNWTDENWPVLKLCQHYLLRFPEWDEYPSDFIDPETRGFKVRELLTDFIDIKDGQMHDEPWVAPECEYLEVIPPTEVDKIAGIKHRFDAPMHKPDHYLKYAVVSHINSGQAWAEDFAQRVNTALVKSLKNNEYRKNLWILYNLAGLYWRMQGNNLKAVECLRRCLHHAPEEHKDVALTGMANVMYRLARVNDAVIMLVDALKINRSEPVTYMVMGNALQAYANFTGAIEFYTYALLLNPTYREAFHSLMIVKCADKVVKLNKESEEAARGGEVEKVGSNENKSVPVKPQSITEFMQDGAILYTVPRTSAPLMSEVISENEVGLGDLVSKIETQNGYAGTLMRDADSVIKRLSESLESNNGVFTERESKAKALMSKLREMRSSLVTLVEEAAALQPAMAEFEGISDLDCENALKKVDLNQYVGTTIDLKVRGIDFDTELASLFHYGYIEEQFEPDCNMETGSFIASLDAVRNRDQFTGYRKEPAMTRILEWLVPIFNKGYLTEKQLQRLLVNRLSKGLEKYPKSWKLSILASFYWRQEGNVKKAIDCLCLSYTNAPIDMKDIALLGLSNIFAFLKQWKDAITVATQAIDLAPEMFVHYLTLANIYAAKGEVKHAIPYYQKALELQPDCKSGKMWLKAAVCTKAKKG